VAKRECTSCRSSEAAEIAAGSSFPDKTEVVVPRDSKLLLAFSLSAALVEPEAGVSLVGPARAVVDGERLRLERGVADVVTGTDVGSGMKVSTPHVSVVAARGRFSIDTDESRSRIVVEAGSAHLRTQSGDELDLMANGIATAGDDGHIVVADPPKAGGAPRSGIADIVRAAVSSGKESQGDMGPRKSKSPPDSPEREPSRGASPTPEMRWRAARHALDANDRGLAERELRELLHEIAPTEPLYPRVAFTLAELELARGSVIEARPRLEAIVRGPDEQLAEDAATMLARSYPTPPERVMVWKKYLETSPPSARRERALRELCGRAPADAACSGK
jgi:hypothetical protein